MNTHHFSHGRSASRKTTLVSVIEKENHYQYLAFDDTNLLALAKKSEEIRRGSSRTDHF